MNRFKDTIRAWLGLDLLPSVEMLKAMEKKQKERHDELLTLLNALTTQQANQRPQSQSVPRQWDWETVQAMALKSLEDETKEN